MRTIFTNLFLSILVWVSLGLVFYFLYPNLAIWLVSLPILILFETAVLSVLDLFYDQFKTRGRRLIATILLAILIVLCLYLVLVSYFFLSN